MEVGPESPYPTLNEPSQAHSLESGHPALRMSRPGPMSQLTRTAHISWRSPGRLRPDVTCQRTKMTGRGTIETDYTAIPFLPDISI